MNLSTPPGENETTTAISEPKLKQILFNTGQNNGFWPGPQLGLPENGTNYISQCSERQNPQGHLLPVFVQLGVSVHTKVLPIYVALAYV